MASTASTPHTLAELSRYFHLPINDVAKELGVCATVLKKICRKNGITRWPHRKIKSLARMIETLESVAPASPADAAAIRAEIESLQNKKRFLMQNPNVSFKAVVPKYCTTVCQTRGQQRADSDDLDSPQPSSPPPPPDARATRLAAKPAAASKRTHEQAFTASTSASIGRYPTLSIPSFHAAASPTPASTARSYPQKPHHRHFQHQPPAPAPAPQLQPQHQHQQHAFSVPSPNSPHEVDAASILMAFSQLGQLSPMGLPPLSSTPSPRAADSLPFARSRPADERARSSALYTSSDAVACINSLPTLRLKSSSDAIGMPTTSSSSTLASSVLFEPAAKRARHSYDPVHDNDSYSSVSLPPISTAATASHFGASISPNVTDLRSSHNSLPILPPLSRHLSGIPTQHQASSPSSSPIRRSPDVSPSTTYHSSPPSALRHHQIDHLPFPNTSKYPTVTAAIAPTTVIATSYDLPNSLHTPSSPPAPSAALHRNTVNPRPIMPRPVVTAPQQQPLDRRFHDAYRFYVPSKAK